jgi:hypothetical protein
LGGGELKSCDTAFQGEVSAGSNVRLEWALGILFGRNSKATNSQYSLCWWTRTVDYFYIEGGTQKLTKSKYDKNTD